MEITEVKVFPVREEKLKAFVSVVIDHCFMVNDIKIIHGRQGLFISMPSRKKKNGDFKDVAHPLNNDTRKMIEGLILTEYDRVLSDGDGDGASSRPRSIRTTGETKHEPTEETKTAKKNTEEPEEKASAKTLEEVEEVHLRDSFWTVP